MGQSSKSVQPKTLILYLILIGLGVSFLFESTEKTTPKTARKKSEVQDPSVRDLASFLPRGSSQHSEAADVFFKTGFREFREGNYVRARIQFETALQVDPNHYLAKLYLSNCTQAVESEVKHQLNLAKRSQDLGKYRESQNYYESVLRLLHYDRSHAAFQEAQVQLVDLKKKIREGD